MDDALEDALRLSHMMSLKAAASNLPHGGAKAVLIAPHDIKDRKAYMEVFGDFVHSLGGRYVTAVDVGTDISDMDVIATRTPYVTCTSDSKEDGDPSPHTAFGVCRGIEAAVKFKLGKNDLNNIHVIIQGLGHVGYALAKELHQRGAVLTVADVNEKAIDQCIKEFNAHVCAPDEVYDIKADVFAPCALGGILNLHTIKKLCVPIVAGSANNQLAHHHHGVILHERGILYAPDFLINVGGLIYASSMYDHGDPAKARDAVNHIYDNLMDLFEKSQKENVATSEMAEKMALEKLK
jgi:leucine dehydrogenase